VVRVVLVVVQVVVVRVVVVRVVVVQVAVIRRHITALEVATAAQALTFEVATVARAPTFVGPGIHQHAAVVLEVLEEAADLRQRRSLHENGPLVAPRALIDGMILDLPTSLSRDLPTPCVPSMGFRRKTKPAFHHVTIKPAFHSVKPIVLVNSYANSLHCNKALLFLKNQMWQIRLAEPVIGRSEIRPQTRDLRRAVNLSCRIFRLPRRIATKKRWRGFLRRPL
jgi:hypothetical protein